MTHATPSDRVLVAVCTYRRLQLDETLQSLAGLDPCGLPVCIAIADNDATPSARQLVEGAALRHPLQITYLHAPKANISIARNALMDHARSTGARLIAFLDDDETVEPQWLANLVAKWRNSDAGVVLGPVIAHYRPSAPGWMDKARAHDTQPVVGRDGTIRTGYTCNVLIDLGDPAASKLSFDLARGRTGGEDSAFFSAFADAGGRIAYAPDAVAHEVVPDDRARLGWLMRRRYRMGQTHASLLTGTATGAGRLRQASVAAAKAAACGGMALVGALYPAWRNRQLMRAALHVGAFSQLCGARQLELYGSALDAGNPIATSDRRPR